MHKGGTVYIVASPNRTTLYTGVTSNLYKRIWEHRNSAYPMSFTARYNCVVLVYYNAFDNIQSAIAEEKRIKAGGRSYKEQLIESVNKDWRDLWDELVPW